MINSAIRFLRNTTTLEMAWVCLWFAAMSFSQRTAQDSLYGGVDSTHFQRYIFDAIAFALILVKLGRMRPLSWDPLSLFLIYTLIGLLSALWTVSLLSTLGKAGELFMATLIVALIMVRPDPLARLRRLIDWLAILLGGLLIVVLIGFVVAPETFSVASAGVIARQIEAPIISANGISAAGAFICLVCFSRYIMAPRGSVWRTRYLLMFFFFAIFPILAQGRTGQAMVAAGVGFLLLRRSPGVAFLLILPPIAAFVFAFSSEVTTFVTRGQQAAQVASLSGRLVLWDWAWEGFKAEPFVGAGFGVGSRHLFFQNVGNFGDTISSVHNGFLEVLLGTGLLGFSFWITSLVWSIGLAFRSFMNGVNLDMAVLMVYVIGTTVMSTGVGGWMSAPAAAFLVLTAYLLVARREARQEARQEAHQAANAAPQRHGGVAGRMTLAEMNMRNRDRNDRKLKNRLSAPRRTSA